MNRSHALPARRAVATGAVLVLATLLAACGGGSSSDGASSDDTTTPTELPADSGTDTGGTDTGAGETTIAEDPTAVDLDICGELTQADMEAILPEATFTSVQPNDVVPTPTCDYNIDIGGVEAAVVSIVFQGTDPAYLEGQRDIQTDPVDVEGVDEGFAFDDYGTILVLGESGVFQIERGVELTNGGEAASQEQMTQIAQAVAEL